MPLAQHARVCVMIAVIAGLAACSRSLPDQVESAYSSLPDQVDYNIHIQPILSDRCYQCHGPDENTRKAGLRLDLEDEAFRRLSSGNSAFIKGKPWKSAAIERCISSDPDFAMPPPDSKLEISPREIALLYKWLEDGAEWKPHWSLIPVERPAIPEVNSPELAANEIDHFVHRKLADHDLTPSTRARKEILLRRVTMDLTGLPPTIEEIDDFLADESASAYESVVDRILASDECAERLALEWLDLARYSDSHGVSFDGARHSWPYRDWVIDAFKANMPYDDFITKQIAGDLLPDGTREDRIATAFYRMGQLEVSGGSIPEEFRVEYIAERTGLTGTAFLGLTVECARCHDHKFDPITQREFYQLSAFFNTTPEPGLSPIDADRAPTMYMYLPGQKEILDSLDFAIAEQRVNIELTKSEIRKLREYLESGDFNTSPPEAVRYVAFDNIEKISKKKKKRNKKTKDEFEDILVVDNDTLNIGKLGVDLVDGYRGKAARFDGEYDYVSLEECGHFELTDPFSVTTWINTDQDEKGPTQTIIGNTASYAGDYSGWDLYLDSMRFLRARLIHRMPDDYLEIKSLDSVPSHEWVNIGMTYDGCGRADGTRLYMNGRKLETTTLYNELDRSILPMNDYTGKTDTIAVRIGKSRRLWTYDVGMFDGAIDELSIYDTKLSSVDMRKIAGYDKEFSEDELYDHAITYDDDIKRASELLRKSLGARHKTLDTTPQLMIMEEMKHPRKTYILERGLYDQHGEVVEPGAISSVLEFDQRYEKNRLGLARWLTDSRNPLTARVAINRYWQMLFGRGIVETAEDFGIQGARPTHPELLDWLASEFVESGWDLKHMLKLMVTSSTYCQSSEIPDHLIEADPDNRLYARGPSHRLQAEMIRDNALAASGLLVKKVGGPPVKPYQPDGLWEELGGTSFQLSKYKRDTLDNLYRRSLYTFSRRFAPSPFMSTFDASSREICQVRRSTTNSPLQALVLLNDPQIVEAARVMSELLLLKYQDLEDQLVAGYRLATGIQPGDRQINVLRNLHKESMENFRSQPQMADSLLAVGDMETHVDLDKFDIAALTIVTSTIFNSDVAYMKR